MTTSVCGIDLGSRIARAEEAGKCAAAVAGDRCHLRKRGANVCTTGFRLLKEGLMCSSCELVARAARDKATREA